MILETEKLLILVVSFVYVFKAPLFSYTPIIILLTLTNLEIFFNQYIGFNINIGSYFLFLLVHLYIKLKFSNKKIFKRIFFISAIVVLIMLLSMNIKIIDKGKLLNNLSLFMTITLFYLEVVSLKFNSLKESIMNLKSSFYIFFVMTSILFGVNFYLIIEKINKPSLVLLLIAIPFSMLIVYFYVKELKVILKEYK